MWDARLICHNSHNDTNKPWDIVEIEQYVQLHPHSKQFGTSVETLLMFVIVSPCITIVGFSMRCQQSDSILPCSHMASLQLSAPVKPIAVWKGLLFPGHTLTHTYTHTFASGWFTLLGPADPRLHDLSKPVSCTIQDELRTHTISSSTPVYNCLFSNSL